MASKPKPLESTGCVIFTLSSCSSAMRKTAHDRVEHVLTMAWIGCSRSRGMGAQHLRNAQSAGVSGASHFKVRIEACPAITSLASAQSWGGRSHPKTLRPP